MEHTISWNNYINCLCPSALKIIYKKGEQLLAKRREMEVLQRQAAELPDRSRDLLLENQILHCGLEAKAIRDQISQFLLPNG